MAAAIILQGLFLVVCHTKTLPSAWCEIVVPTTDMGSSEMHSYVAEGQNSWSIPRAMKNLSIQLSSGKTNPFDQGDIKDHQFILDSTTIVNYALGQARNTIRVNLPTEIRSVSGIEALISVVSPSHEDAKLVKSNTHPASVPMFYTFATGVVLYYANQDQPFNLNDQGGASQVSSFHEPLGAHVLVLTSAPAQAGNGCKPHPRHDDGMNGLLQVQQPPGTDTRNPNFQLTGMLSDQADTVKDEQNPTATRIFKDRPIKLPQPLCTGPSIRIAKGKRPGRKLLLTTAEVEGCGVVFVEDPTS
jgi:hypothetical protein